MFDLKKILLNFVITRWKEILIILLLLVVNAKSRYDISNTISAYEVSEQSLKNQLEEMKSLHDQELKKRDKALNDYLARIEELDSKHKQELEEIQKSSKEKRKAYIKNYSEQQESIKKVFEEEYGIVYTD